MLNQTGNKLIRYFKNPLLGISAISSYGIPNSLVHLPVVLMIPYIGSFLCREGMKPLLVLYFIIALYVGRDLVIMAYKNKIVPVAVWILFILFIVFKAEITGYLTSFPRDMQITVTSALSIGFVFYAAIFSRWLVK